MTNSRQKGARFERAVARWLRSLGFASARRGRQFKGTPDSPDISVPELEDLVHFEAKHVEKYSINDLYDALFKAKREAPATAAPVLIYKRNHYDPLVIMRRADFERFLISHYHNHVGDPE